MKPAPIANLPEFHTGYNNGVTAVYVVHPRLLELDGDRQLWGKPFLFTDKCPDRRDPFVLSNSRNNRIVYAGFTGELPMIRKRREQSHALGGAELPDFVEVSGYGRINMDDLASFWVPFSFGIGHESESKRMEAGEIVVRTDWEQFKRGPLARFDQEKVARAAYESTLGYRFRTAVGLERRI